MIRETNKKAYTNMLGKLTDKHKRSLLRVSSIFLFIFVWWFLSEFGLQFGGVDTSRFPSPAEVLAVSAEVFTEDYELMAMHSWYSLYRVLVGFVVAMLIGIPLGLAIGTNRYIEDLTFPTVEVLRPIPPLAWIPVVLIVAGIDLTMFFITFIGAFFPIVLNTISGVESVKEVEVRAAKCLGASKLRIFKEVIIPKSLPNIFTGLAVGMGISWICIVAAEMIAGNYGLGYYIWSAYNTLMYPHVVLGMVLLGILGYLCSALIRYTGSRIMVWQKYSGGME